MAYRHASNGVHRSRIEGDQVAVFAENVARDFDHVLVTGGSLQRFEGDLGGVALHVASIDDHLDDAIPDLSTRGELVTRANQGETCLFRNEVTGDADQFQHDIQIPFVIDGVFLAENGNFQNLEREACRGDQPRPELLTISSRMV